MAGSAVQTILREYAEYRYEEGDLQLRTFIAYFCSAICAVAPRRSESADHERGQ